MTPGRAMTDDEHTPMTFEAFRQSFYYGSRVDMQFKYLASMTDEEAADAIGRILRVVGDAVDTGDWGAVEQALFEAQVAAYTPREPVEPGVDHAPFTRLQAPLNEVPLTVISAGGVFLRHADPMGGEGPTQQEVLGRIVEFLRSAPTLTEIPAGTPAQELMARHPGYDATTAQRDPNTVFPLEVLADLSREGRVRLSPTHYSFVGATSQSRLRSKVGAEWAQRLLEARVGAALLVAT